MKQEKKKLTVINRENMWGEDGPYSQVRLCEEIRILDDSISRVFLVVEAEINPFTFEYVQKNRKKFKADEAVLQLLDNAEYRGKYGYVVSAGEVEQSEFEAQEFAREQSLMTTETLIRMHRFVIDEFGLEKNKDFGVVKNNPASSHFVWDGGKGEVKKTDDSTDSFFGDSVFVGSHAGVRDNKLRFFIILALEKNVILKKESVLSFVKVLKKNADNFNIQIEDTGIFNEYILIVALIPFDVAPSEFVEHILGDVHKRVKTPLFVQDYLVTNVKKPGAREIINFLKHIQR